MTLTPGKVVLSNPLTCTNTAKGDNKLYSDAKGVVPSLDLRFAEGKNLNDYMTGQQLIQFSRPVGTNQSPGTYVDENGIIQLSSADQPRFDHDPTTGESLGLLIEESRTNQLEYSTDFSQVYWGKTNLSLTANTTTAPDGTTTASAINVLNTNTYAYLSAILNATTGTSYSLSYWVKYNNCQYVWLLGPEATNFFAYFDLINGVVAAANGYDCSITPYPNGWYRIVATRTKAGATSPEEVGIGITRSSAIPNFNEVGDSVYIWGAQIETGSFPTSYIPTTGTALTRSADVASISGSNFSSWYNNAEGSLWVKGSMISTPTPFAANQYSYLASIENTPILDTSVTATLAFLLREQTASLSGPTNAGSGVAGKLSLVTTGTSGTFVVANAFNRSEDNSAFIVRQEAPISNYAEALSGLSAPAAPDATRLVLGRLSSNGVGMRVFHISRLTYFPERLPDSTLQAITQ